MYRYKKPDENSPPRLMNHQVNISRFQYHPFRTRSIAGNGLIRNASNNLNVSPSDNSLLKAQFKIPESYCDKNVLSNVHHFDTFRPHSEDEISAMRFQMPYTDYDTKIQTNNQIRLSESRSNVETSSLGKFKASTEALATDQFQTSEPYSDFKVPFVPNLKTHKSISYNKMLPDKRFKMTELYSNFASSATPSCSIQVLPVEQFEMFDDDQVSSQTHFKMQPLHSDVNVKPTGTFQTQEAFLNNKFPSNMQFKRSELSSMCKKSSSPQFKTSSMHGMESPGVRFKIPTPSYSEPLSSKKIGSPSSVKVTRDMQLRSPQGPQMNTQLTYVSPKMIYSNFHATYMSTPQSVLKNNNEQNILFQLQDSFLKHTGVQKMKSSKFLSGSTSILDMDFNEETLMAQQAEMPNTLKLSDRGQRFPCDNSGIIHLIGSVEYAMQCYRNMREKLSGLSTFQIIGCLERTELGRYSCEKILFIYDDAGFILQGAYHEIDRPLPHIQKDQFLSCTGRLTAIDKMQVYDVQILTTEEYRNIQASLRMINGTNQF